MTQSNTVLTVGSGHIAYRVKKLLEKGGYTVIHFDDMGKEKNGEQNTIDTVTNRLKTIDLSSLRMAFLLDDDDQKTIELVVALISLNENVHITASLFNERIAPHLQAAHPNLKILNPAKIAATAFVDALYTPTTRTLRYTPTPIPKERKAPTDKLILSLVLTFLTSILFEIAYFHVAIKLSLVNAIYYVVTTMAAVDGELSLFKYSVTTKFVSVIMMLSSMLYVWLIFSFTMNYIIKRREQRSLGKKRYRIKNHIILCGLGKLGYFVAEELLNRGEKIIIIEQNAASENIEHFRNEGVRIYVGNAKSPKVLQNVNVVRAKAVLSLVNNDITNLEIGLNARSYKPGLRLVLRIFDDSMVSMIQENLDIQNTLSVSSTVDDYFYGMLQK